MKNPFESLRITGIVGTVASTYSPVTVYSKGMDCVQVLVEEIAPGKWAFGYIIDSKSGQIRKIPGEIQGHFLSRDDAMLYDLWNIKIMDLGLPKEAVDAINSKIWTITNKSLFE